MLNSHKLILRLIVIFLLSYCSSFAVHAGGGGGSSCPSCTCPDCTQYGPYLSCQSNLSSCQSSSSSCQGSLSGCQSTSSACQGSLTGCQNNLATCNAAVAAQKATANLPCCAITLTQPTLNLGTLTSNATAILNFEANLLNFLLNKSTYNFGYTMYKEGRLFSSGQKEVINNPKTTMSDAHNSVYCTTAFSAEASCQASQSLQSSGSSISASDAQYLTFGDVKFATLLVPKVYSQAVDLAAQNLIRNLTNPFPSAKYKSSIAGSDFSSRGDKQQDYANNLASSAALGVAFYSLDKMYGMRTSNTTLALSAITGSSSMLSTMENEAINRFEQGTFASHLTDTNVVGTSATATTDLDALKQIAAIAAFGLWMDYQFYKQDERIEATVATGLSKFVIGAAAATAQMNSNGGG
jgi:hypothetical protein